MKRKLIAFTLSFVLACLIVIEVRVLLSTEDYVHLSDIDYLQREQTVLIGAIEQLEMSLEKYQNELKTLSEAQEAETGIEDLLRSEIDKYKMYAGMTPVEGEGVLVIIDDSNRALLEDEDPMNLIVHDIDVRNMVDDLRNAGAEAISINGVRVVFGQTEIVCNGPTIRINDIQQAQPYIIRAIGDKFHLASAINAPDTYGNSLRQLGLEIEVNTMNYLVIDQYNSIASFDYLSPVVNRGE